MKSTTIQYSLSAPTISTVIRKPSINIKGVTSVRFVLSGFEDIFNPAVKLEVLWGDTTTKTNFFRPLAYNYKTQSILNEVIYGELAGTLFAHYDHVFSNNTTSYNYPLTSQFLITFKNGKTVYIYQPLNIFKGSFYDDIANLDILNTQITPTSSNNTIINFEGSNDQTYISVLRNGTSLTFDNANYNSTCIPLCSVTLDSVWVGFGSNNNWSTRTNWNVGRPPLSSTNVSFGFSNRLAPFNDLVTGIPYKSISFNNDAGAYKLSGNSFTLYYSGGIVNNSTNLQTIANNISLSGTGGILVNSADGNITLAGAISGTNSLIKTGVNTLTLSGTNTYTGNTTVSAGTLKAGSTIGLSISSAFSVIAGTTLDLNGYNNTIKGFASDTATGTITNTSTTGAELTLGVAMGTSSTAASAAQLITGNLAVQLYGGTQGNTILTNNSNTYNGGTTLGKGTSAAITRLLLSAVTYGSGSPGAITSGIFGTGPVTVGANTTDRSQLYFGGTSIFNYDIVVNSLSGDNTFIGALRVESVGSTLAGTLSANQADAIFSANNASGRTATVTGAIRGDYGIRVVSMSATTTATGSLTLTLANTGTNTNDYSGNTTIYGTGKATLKLGASNQIPSGVNKSNLNALSGTFNMNGFNETINGLFGAGIIDGGTGNPTLTIGDNDTSSIFSGIIKNTAGSLSAVKIGTGTLTLTANNNTYSGSTSINAGAIVVTQGIASAVFTPTLLTVTFSTPPPVGVQTYQFFTGRTVQTYSPVTLVNAFGRTGSYNSTNSTLTITA